MKSIFPTPTSGSARSGRTGSGFGILDTFLQMLPMIQQQKREEALRGKAEQIGERQYNDRVRKEQQQNIVPPMMMPQRGLNSVANRMEQDKPMDVVLANQMTPYQEANIELRRRQMDTKGALDKAKLEQTDAKNKVSEGDRATRTAILQKKADNDNLTEKEAMELTQLNALARQDDAQKFTTGRDITTQESALANIKARGVEADTKQTKQQEFITAKDKANFDRDIAKIDKTFTNKEKLQNDKELAPGQQKTAAQLKYNELVNEHPAYKNFVSINPDTGLVEVAEETKPGKVWGNTDGPTKEQREEILSFLGMGGKGKKADAKKSDPAGIRQ